MTLPNERYRAIKNAREFLRSLLDPKSTPGVPKKIRMAAYYVLKHYPSDYDMLIAAEDFKQVFEVVKDNK